MTVAIRYTFKVNERLKREQHIDTLFRTGKAFSVFPVKFVYTLAPLPEAQASKTLAGFSVPKRKFKSSVHRHRVRRLMVEAWRLNKQQLIDAMPAEKQLHIFMIFIDGKMPDFLAVHESIAKGIQKLATEILPKYG